MTDLPLTPTATRHLLERLGHEPRRRLGQNFLVDGNIVRKSLLLADLKPGDTVIEIGPGLGTLTRALLAAGMRVFAVEYDPRLAAYLREELVPAFPKRFSLMEGDAVDHPLAGYTSDGTEPGFKIVANLPYAISTPWLEAVLEGPLPARMVLMLQKEAADRYTAKPGSKHFGAISVFLDATYQREPGHTVSRQCFHPVPGIDSVLLTLGRLPHPRCYRTDTRAAIRKLFIYRRKQIGAAAKLALPTNIAENWLKQLTAQQIKIDTRAEALPLSVWPWLDALYSA